VTTPVGARTDARARRRRRVGAWPHCSRIGRRGRVVEVGTATSRRSGLRRGRISPDSALLEHLDESARTAHDVPLHEAANPRRIAFAQSLNDQPTFVVRGGDLALDGGVGRPASRRSPSRCSAAVSAILPHQHETRPQALVSCIGASEPYRPTFGVNKGRRVRPIRSASISPSTLSGYSSRTPAAIGSASTRAVAVLPARLGGVDAAIDDALVNSPRPGPFRDGPELRLRAFPRGPADRGRPVRSGSPADHSDRRSSYVPPRSTAGGPRPQ
jgi:hypothetical protein